MSASLSGKTNAVDEVNPDYYSTGGVETVDFIKAKKLGYCLGCAVKYISRAGKKGDREIDLRKAIRYLQLELGE